MKERRTDVVSLIRPNRNPRVHGEPLLVGSSHHHRFVLRSVRKKKSPLRPHTWMLRGGLALFVTGTGKINETAHSPYPTPTPSPYPSNTTFRGRFLTGHTRTPVRETWTESRYSRLHTDTQATTPGHWVVTVLIDTYLPRVDHKQLTYYTRTIWNGTQPTRTYRLRRPSNPEGLYVLPLRPISSRGWVVPDTESKPSPSWKVETSLVLQITGSILLSSSYPFPVLSRIDLSKDVLSTSCSVYTPVNMTCVLFDTPVDENSGPSIPPSTSVRHPPYLPPPSLLVTPREVLVFRYKTLLVIKITQT